jgi:hypothetical protein
MWPTRLRKPWECLTRCLSTSSSSSELVFQLHTARTHTARVRCARSIVWPQGKAATNYQQRAMSTTSAWTGNMSQEEFMMRDECLVLDMDDNVVGHSNKCARAPGHAIRQRSWSTHSNTRSRVPHMPYESLVHCTFNKRQLDITQCSERGFVIDLPHRVNQTCWTCPVNRLPTTHKMLRVRPSFNPVKTRCVRTLTRRSPHPHHRMSPSQVRVAHLVP